MTRNNYELKLICGKRLEFQKYYEPKLRELVELRTDQLCFDNSDKERALKSIDALMWKLTAAGTHLERLWEFKETKTMKSFLNYFSRNIPNPIRFIDSEVAYLNVEFEAYLIQARAFINIAQIHTLDACRIKFGGQLTNEKYKVAVESAKNDVNKKITKAYEYFQNEVFGKNKWGELLKSLRDRVVHFDRIRPSHNNKSGTDQQTVRGLTLESLAQDFENGSYYMLVEVISPIWDREWIAGPYKQGMWN